MCRTIEVIWLIGQLTVKSTFALNVSVQGTEFVKGNLLYVDIIFDDGISRGLYFADSY